MALAAKQFGEVYSDGPGSPPLPTRLMAGLHILKYSENLSDAKLLNRVRLALLLRLVMQAFLVEPAPQKV